MKFVKYFFVLLLSLILLFVAKGFLTPSISYSSEITVEKPLKEAWAVMSDESKTSLWLEGIIDSELVSGQKGEIGSVTKYTFSNKGQETYIYETLKSIEEEKYVDIDFVIEGVKTMDYRMDFSFLDGKTVIKSSTTTTGDGMLMRSMLSFMQNSMLEQEEKNMNNLKKVIDQNTTDYFFNDVE